MMMGQILLFRVPTRTGKPGKPGKMGRHFPVREKSGNFKQTGKVRENFTKYWKIQGISYYLLFSGNFILFVIFGGYLNDLYTIC